MKRKCTDHYPAFILLFISLFVILISSADSYGQEVKNIRVSQVVNRVTILYDLTGTEKPCKVMLFFTPDDGKTWLGPLKNVSGDVGENQLSGINKTISWDALAESGPIEGVLQFKVVAELMQGKTKIETKEALSKTKPWLSNGQYIKFKRSKNVWLTFGLVGAATGVFSLLESNKLYDDYQTATNNAASIHKKIKTLDIITPVAFGVSGICGIGFVVQSSKQGKLKKQLSFNASSEYEGGSLKLTFNF